MYELKIQMTEINNSNSQMFRNYIPFNVFITIIFSFTWRERDRERERERKILILSTDTLLAHLVWRS